MLIWLTLFKLFGNKDIEIACNFAVNSEISFAMRFICMYLVAMEDLFTSDSFIRKQVDRTFLLEGFFQTKINDHYYYDHDLSVKL